VAVPLLLLGIPVVIAGVVLTAKSLRIAKLILLVGAAITALAVWVI
jgi:hypothetical protein